MTSFNKTAYFTYLKLYVMLSMNNNEYNESVMLTINTFATNDNSSVKSSS